MENFLKSALFWGFTCRWKMISYRRFGKAYRPNLQITNRTWRISWSAYSLVEPRWLIILIKCLFLASKRSFILFLTDWPFYLFYFFRKCRLTKQNCFLTSDLQQHQVYNKQEFRPHLQIPEELKFIMPFCSKIKTCFLNYEHCTRHRSAPVHDM